MPGSGGFPLDDRASVLAVAGVVVGLALDPVLVRSIVLVLIFCLKATYVVAQFGLSRAGACVLAPCSAASRADRRTGPVTSRLTGAELVRHVSANWAGWGQ